MVLGTPQVSGNISPTNTGGRLCLSSVFEISNQVTDCVLYARSSLVGGWECDHGFNVQELFPLYSSFMYNSWIHF